MTAHSKSRLSRRQSGTGVSPVESHQPGELAHFHPSLRPGVRSWRTQCLPAPPRPIARGFTLIELLVVITMITIASAAVAPSFLKNSDAYRLRAAERRLCDLLAFCRSMAVFESAGYRVEFHPDVGEARVLFEADPLEAPGRFRPLRLSNYGTLRLPEGVRFEAVDVESTGLWDVPQDEGESRFAAIEFRRDGSASEAMLTIQSEDGSAKSIHLSGLTGTVRILEGPATLEGVRRLGAVEEDAPGSFESGAPRQSRFADEEVGLW